MAAATPFDIDEAASMSKVTNAFMFEAFKLFAAWGFEFRTTLVWVKPQLGLGNYWRNSHEVMMTAVRNDSVFNDNSFESVLKCKRGAHSAKPEQVRAMIEVVSNGPFIELFGRRAVPGWTVWGDQVEHDLLSGGPPGTRTAGVIQAGIARILCEVGLPAFIAVIAGKIHAEA
jgi:N6-adenosine-specific RNA methylase IME4